ncbi:hypothetical protein [Christiangramia portivictoriae]|uniref:hypothetical protein n=1 Tax=Christiangramia portivictoriae TaxID=326069 RepID=UPI00041AFC46|nr:hypothetical protein [Christiangramia portivictoriae]
MSKLYVFGIGGTGARVIKSLIHLLASGVKMEKNITTVVPILIDPDNGNGDLTRTMRLLSLYKELQTKVDRNKGFFSTSIQTLNDLTNAGVTINNQFKMLDVNAAQNQKFRSFIGHGSLSKESQSLMELLFSEDNLNADMSVGFKGNPNIGSIVLNQFKNSPEYKVFTSSFSQGDSIFVISSIFGGTGAAGFPLLLRNLRKVDPNIPGSDNVASAPIGALSMMPYFKVNEPDDSNKKTIDSGTFMGKAKAALSHYSTSIFQNNEIDAFYTLGEDAGNFYEHNDGQASQRNNAHFLELAAATSIIDFTLTKNQLPRSNDLQRHTHFREFGIKEDTRNLNFKTLGDSFRNTIMTPLSQFYLMSLFNKNVKMRPDYFAKSPWYIHLNPVYSNDGLHEKYLKEFETHFIEWFDEMKNNDVSFHPFKESPNYNALLNFINEYDSKGGILNSFLNNKDHGDKFQKTLNTSHKKFQSSNDLGKDFLILFEEATEKQIASVIK